MVASRSEPPGVTTSTTSSERTAPTPWRSCSPSSASSRSSGIYSDLAGPFGRADRRTACRGARWRTVLRPDRPRWSGRSRSSPRTSPPTPRTTTTRRKRTAGRGWRLGIGFALVGLAARRAHAPRPRQARTDRSTSLRARGRSASARSAGGPLRAGARSGRRGDRAVAVGTFGLLLIVGHRAAPDRTGVIADAARFIGRQRRRCPHDEPGARDDEDPPRTARVRLRRRPRRRTTSTPRKRSSRSSSTRTSTRNTKKTRSTRKRKKKRASTTSTTKTRSTRKKARKRKRTKTRR